MGELLSDVFREDVPDWETLEPQLRRWLEQDMSLENIREQIYDHIFERLLETDPPEGDGEEEWEKWESEQAGEAMNRAFSVVDGLIENLPVTEQNRQRLLDYIAEGTHLDAYDRLLTDFLPLLSEEEIKEILAQAQDWFIPEATAEWEENVKRELRRRKKGYAPTQRAQRGGMRERLLGIISHATNISQEVREHDAAI